MFRTRCLAFAAILAACSSDSIIQQHGFRIIEEDGVPTAVSSGTPKFEGDLYTYEIVLRVIPDPEVEESYLNQVSGNPVLSDDGMIYVADGGDYRIAVYDGDGRFIRSIGRRGEGPGDLQSLDSFTVANGILSLFDSRLSRRTLFRTDGSLQEIISAPFGMAYLDNLHRAPDGSLITFEEIARLDRIALEMWSFGRALVLNVQLDTLSLLETPRVRTHSSVRQISGSINSYPLEYSARPVVLYIPGTGILLGSGEEPVLTWHELDGQVKSRIRIDLPPEPISKAEIDAIETFYDDWIAGAAEIARGNLKARKDALKLPLHKPFCDLAFVDDNGYYWLRRSETYTQRAEAGGSLFRVLSPEGEYLGDTRWPALFGNVMRGYLLSIVTDPETGEEIPTQFRLAANMEDFEFPN